MLGMKLIDHVLQLENVRLILRGRHAVPHISFIPKCNFTWVKYKAKKGKNNDDDKDDELDKPIKFSTSKAATFPAAYSYAAAQEVPWYQGIVLSLSMFVFCAYFFHFREENDIDEDMVKNIPEELLVQIYGKEHVKKYNK